MKSIPHSINIAIPSSTEPQAQVQFPPETIKDLQTQLLQYSEKNLEKVRRSALEVSWPCSETCSVAYVIAGGTAMPRNRVSSVPVGISTVLGVPLWVKQEHSDGLF
jgi:hypothetical protein